MSATAQLARFLDLVRWHRLYADAAYHLIALRAPGAVRRSGCPRATWTWTAKPR